MCWLSSSRVMREMSRSSSVYKGWEAENEVVEGFVVDIGEVVGFDDLNEGTIEGAHSKGFKTFDGGEGFELLPFFEWDPDLDPDAAVLFESGRAVGIEEEVGSGGHTMMVLSLSVVSAMSKVASSPSERT